jgi:hypothetical protein
MASPVKISFKKALDTVNTREPQRDTQPDVHKCRATKVEAPK